MNSYEQISALLETHDRGAILEIVTHGLTLPATAKALAYMAIQNMSQSAIDDICNKGKTALDFMAAEDWEGLEKFLSSAGVPVQMISVIKSYASNQLDK